MSLFNKNPETPNNPNPEAPAGPTIAEQIAESLKTGLQPLVEANTALANRLEAIETNTKRPTPVVEPTEMPSVFDDENAAINMRIAPVAQRQLQMEARMSYNEVKAEYVASGYGDVLAKYETEITNTLAGSPLLDSQGKLCRGNPDYIRNVIDMVFGREARKSGVKFGGKDKGFFIESANGDPGRNPTGPIADGLTEGQRKVFARMGIKSEDGAKTIGKLQFVN